MFDFDQLAKLLWIYRIRIRRDNYKREVARVLVQAFLCFAGCLLMVYLMFLPLANEPPWLMPLRMYRDTFGDLHKLFQFQPPVMDRARYETEGNMWKQLTFSPEGNLGRLQDMAFALWNWGTVGLWTGSWRTKIQVCAACVAIYGPGLLYMSLRGSNIIKAMARDRAVTWAASKTIGNYIMWAPESLLILEQLYHAQKMGRQLSEGALEYLEVEENNLMREEEEMRQLKLEKEQGTLPGGRDDSASPRAELMGAESNALSTWEHNRGPTRPTQAI